MRWTPDGGAIIYKDDRQGLWQQPFDDERPHLVRGFEEMLLHNLAWSFDGKELG